MFGSVFSSRDDCCSCCCSCCGGGDVDDSDVAVVVVVDEDDADGDVDCCSSTKLRVMNVTSGILDGMVDWKAMAENL